MRIKAIVIRDVYYYQASGFHVFTCRHREGSEQHRILRVVYQSGAIREYWDDPHDRTSFGGAEVPKTVQRFIWKYTPDFHPTGIKGADAAHKYVYGSIPLGTNLRYHEMFSASGWPKREH